MSPPHDDSVMTEQPATDEVADIRSELAATRAALSKAQEELARHQSEARRLSGEIEKALEGLESRTSEVGTLQNELRIVRVLADRLRRTAEPAISDSRAGVMSRAVAWLRALVSLDWIFHPARSAEERAIRQSGLFNADWYLRRYPDVVNAGLEAMSHYLKFGAWEGRDPSPLFDTAWYKTKYPEVTRQELTALGHFVMVGAAKGYDPNPLFHTAWYVANNADVDGTNPLRHYLDHATEAGRNPNPLFDSAWYLSDNPDVADGGENPLAHYIHHGIPELRNPHPLFDTEWYLEHYEHVAAAGMDALEHYLTVGAFEGCRPSPDRREGDMPKPKKRMREAALTPTKADYAAVPLRTADVMQWQVRLGTQRPRLAVKPGPIGVFVHLYYESLAEEIAENLLAIPFDFQLYISTNTREKKAVIEDVFRQYGMEPVIKILPNRGWDIAPFLLGFGDEIRAHEICLKLHGKRSRHGADKFGDRWRAHLLSGLLGQPRNVSFIVENFLANPKLGIVMMPHFSGVARHANVIGANFQAMHSLLSRIGLSISPEQPIEFPSGSMFWFRGAALASVLDLGLTWGDFSRCRVHDLDATIAHGIERSFLVFAAESGFRWAFLPRRWTGRLWPGSRKSRKSRATVG
jgi:hypothetical protein